MKKNYIVALFFVATAFFASCGGKKGTGMSAAHVKIPKDVSMVMSADLKQIQSKSASVKDMLKGSNAKQLNMDKQMLDMLSQVVDAIDTDQKFYFFLKEADKNSYMAMSFVLKDNAKFKKLFGKDSNLPLKPDFKKEGGIEFASFAPLAPFAIGYKDKTALIMLNKSLKDYAPQPSYRSIDEVEDDIEDGGSMDDAAEEEMPRRKPKKRQKSAPKRAEKTESKGMSEEEFKKTFLQVFNTSAAESLQETGFTACEAGGYDLGVWYRLEAIQDLQKAQMGGQAEAILNMSPLLKQLSDMKGTAYAGMKFESGQIAMETATYVDKEFAKHYEAIVSKANAQKIGGNISISSPTAVAGMSLDMNALYNFLKTDKSTMEGMDMSMRDVDLTGKDVFDIFDGNFVAATGNIDPKAFKKANAVEFVFAIGLNNKEKFSKLLKKAIDSGLLEREENGVYSVKMSMPGVPDMFFVEKGTTFFFTLSKNVKDDLARGKGGMDVSKIKGNAFSMFVDVQRFMKMLPEEAKGDKESQLVFSKIKDFTVAAPPMKNGVMNGKMVVRFTESKNALLIIAEIGEALEKAKKRNEISLR